MKRREVNFDIILDDIEHQSQTAHVNAMNSVKLPSDLYESNEIHLKQEKCDVDISANTGEDSVDIPGQCNCNLFSSTNDNKFKCNICSKSFATKYFITKHLCENINDKGFICNICNLSFPFKSMLITHLRIHNCEKPFKCK